MDRLSGDRRDAAMTPGLVSREAKSAAYDTDGWLRFRQCDVLCQVRGGRLDNGDNGCSYLGGERAPSGDDDIELPVFNGVSQ